MEEDPSSVADNSKLSSDYTEKKSDREIHKFPYQDASVWRGSGYIICPDETQRWSVSLAASASSSITCAVHEFPRLDVIDSIDSAVHLDQSKENGAEQHFTS